jgi:hypothetical protein
MEVRRAGGGGCFFVERSERVPVIAILASVPLIPEERERRQQGQDDGEEDGEGEGGHERKGRRPEITIRPDAFNPRSPGGSGHAIFRR